jgi:hypothetical protein
VAQLGLTNHEQALALALHGWTAAVLVSSRHSRDVVASCALP